MKKKLSFIIEIIIGIIFICLGYFVIDTDYYSTLFYAMGFGLAFASGVQLLKICYYEMPKNKEKLESWFFSVSDNDLRVLVCCVCICVTSY